MQRPPTSFAGLVDAIIGLINSFIPVLFGVLFLFIIWKIIDTWILNAGNDTKLEEGRWYITISLIVFVIMLSAWGIVALLRQSLFGN